MKALLPSWPSEPAAEVKFTVVPADRVRLARVRSAERYAPLLPVLEVMVLAP
jgi:hypothetical protein